MPWSVKKSDSCPPSHPWAVVKDSDGEVEGCHASEEMAREQMKALYAAEDKTKHREEGMPMGRSWYSIENRADSAEIWLYDEVGLFGITAQQFIADLNAIKAPAITMRVHSPGGGVFDGMAIYNAIGNHPAKVTVHIDGVAASAASFIAMAGDKVLAERTATLMIHDGHGEVRGNSKGLRELAELLDKCSDNIASIYADKAGGTVEQWRDRMRAETWYSATEAKAAGLVDEVVSGRARITNTAFDLSLFRYAGRDKAPDPFNHAPPEPVPVQPAPADDPPDEAGFLMPALDLEQIRNAIDSTFEVPFDADIFKAAIDLAINDAPAPDPIPQPTPETPELGPSINLPDLRRAIREAML